MALRRRAVHGAAVALAARRGAPLRPRGPWASAWLLRPTCRATRRCKSTTSATSPSSTGSGWISKGVLAAQGSDPKAGIRNVGIMAHIDAGKTTTTERMLFYAGTKGFVGNVDDGNTEMDYLAEERARGITIASAATSFQWAGCTFNLIDTPGHVDFTIEVERALRVLDGAVAVLDGVAGVEAQTVTVWRQASKFGIPRLAFVNKMDREGADFRATVQMLRDKLGAVPVVTQLPMGSGARFMGVLDLLPCEEVTFDDGDEGQTVRRAPVAEGSQHWPRLVPAREALLEALAEDSVELTEAIMESTVPGFTDVDMDLVASVVGQPAQRFVGLWELISNVRTPQMRASTLACRVVPVLCGASRRNQGVQPLLDAMVNYLPCPAERPPVALTSRGTKDGSAMLTLPPEDGPHLCALAFKVVADKHKGLVTLLRIYSGVLTARASVVNTTRRHKERCLQLLQVHADSYESLKTAGAGSIVAVVGFKNVYSGDTLTHVNDRATKNGVLHGIDVPQPVFSCSLECESASEEAALGEALELMQREDPSLTVSVDEAEGQLLMHGMGELHLEIVLSRLKTQHKLKVYPGAVRVAYREAPSIDARVSHTYNKAIGGVPQALTMEFEVTAVPGLSQPRLDFAAEVLASLSVEEQENVHEGTQAACSRGVLEGYPVAGAVFTLASVAKGEDAAAAALSVCASDAIHKALEQAQLKMLEPVMAVEVLVEEATLGAVLTDLSSMRKGQILGVDGTEEMRAISAEVALVHMVGYSSALRALTHGSGTFSMQFAKYEPRQ